MSLIRVNFIIVLMLFFLGLIQDVLWPFLFQWMGLLLIADLILVRLKVVKESKAKETLSKLQSLNAENQYGGEA
jgi:hypothetical protein